MPHTPAAAVLPSWFRGVLIALVTLLMCSCQAPIEAPSSLAIKAVSEFAAHEGVSPAVEPSSPSDMASFFEAVVDEPAADEPAAKLAVAEPTVIEAAIAEPAVAEFEAMQANEVTPVGCRSCRQGNVRGGCMAGANCRSCVVPGGDPLGPLDEYLCDGGDCGIEAGLLNDWTVTGLEQEDTVAHYHTVDGDVCVTPSNRVCIYAPRFGAVRRVMNPLESNQRDFINVLEEDASLSQADAPVPPVAAIAEQPPVMKVGDNPASLLRNREQAGELEARVVIREVKNLIRPYSNLQIVKLGIVDNTEKPWLAKGVVSALTWAGDQAPQVVIEQKAASVLISSVSPGVVYATPKGKPCLRLLKLASTDNAELGDEISFTLRVDNVGTEAVGNVTVVDNLATRLSYVPESAEASVDAKFKTSRNAGGSLVLRWEITDPIEPGEGAVITFRVKVL